MTIEEQVQKSMSQANLAASPSGVGLAAGAAEASSTHVCTPQYTLHSHVEYGDTLTQNRHVS